MEFIFYCYNWWGLPIYKNEYNRFICKVDEEFYTLSDNEDIDSEPYHKLDKNKIKIIN